MPRMVGLPDFANPPGYKPPGGSEAPSSPNSMLSTFKALGDIGTKYAGQQVAGDAETLAMMGTGLYGAAESGWAGLASGGDTGLMEKVQQARTYMPRSEAGQERLQGMGQWVQGAGENLLPVREWAEKHANALLPLPIAAGIYAGLAAGAEVAPTGKAKPALNAMAGPDLMDFAGTTLKHDPKAVGQVMTDMRGGPRTTAPRTSSMSRATNT